jgi:hypothetical protein
MTSFARTPEGRAAAERMMRTHGHTNAFMPPRPGFPGDPEQKARMLEVQKNLQQNLGDGLGPMPANSPQLAQMQGMLQGAPIGGVVPARSSGFGGGLRRAIENLNLPAPAPMVGTGMQGGGARQSLGPANPMPMPQQPVRRSGVSSQGSAPPSMASQLGGMGLAGTGLQQMFGNKPAGMKKGGAVKKKAGSKTYKSGGSVSSASKRADGCAIKGKTKGKIV